MLNAVNSKHHLESSQRLSIGPSNVMLSELFNTITFLKIGPLSQFFKYINKHKLKTFNFVFLDNCTITVKNKCIVSTRNNLLH